MMPATHGRQQQALERAPQLVELLEVDRAGDAGERMRCAHQFITRWLRLAGQQSQFAVHHRDMTGGFFDKNVVQTRADADVPDHNCVIRRRRVGCRFSGHGRGRFSWYRLQGGGRGSKCKRSN